MRNGKLNHFRIDRRETPAQRHRRGAVPILALLVLAFATGKTHSSPLQDQCAIDGNDVRQRIDGFGASSAWRSTWTTAQADMFFSTNAGTGISRNGTNFSFTGIGLSLLRTHIYPDGTTTETDIMRMAQARGARVWSAPWSPPGIYKVTNSWNITNEWFGGNFSGGAATNEAYANQLAKYVADMKNTFGVRLYALSIQNEPDADVTTYEACKWTQQQFHDFLPYLSAALAARDAAFTKIILPESQNWKFGLALSSMRDVATSNLVGILVGHGYGSSAARVSIFGTPCPKPLWQAEDCNFASNDQGINDAIGWAKKIHLYLTTAQVNGWHYWWLISGNTTSSQGLADTNEVPAKRMYSIGNFSRFVRPGYYRIGVTNNSAAQISGYRYPHSGNFAIVAINGSNESITQAFNLVNLPIPRSVTPWITSSNVSLANEAAIPISGASFTYILPAKSVITFDWHTNLPPVDIALLNATIEKNPRTDTTVGILLAEDPDAANTFTYALAAGIGGEDNSSFRITGNVLGTGPSFHFGTRSNGSVRIRATDQDGLSVEKVFTITLTNQVSR